MAGLTPVTIRVYRSRSANPKQRWRWTLIASNGRKIANSGEGYARRSDASRMADYVVREAHMSARLEI